MRLGTATEMTQKSRFAIAFAPTHIVHLISFCLAVSTRFSVCMQSRMSARAALFTQIGIAITFTQTLNVYKNINASWPDVLTNFFAFFSFLNFDVSMLSLGCFSNDGQGQGWGDPVVAVAFILLMPVFVIVVVAGLSAGTIGYRKYMELKQANGSVSLLPAVCAWRVGRNC